MYKDNIIKYLFITTCFILTIRTLSPFSLAADYKVEPVTYEQIKICKVLLNKDVTIKSAAIIKSQHHKRAYYVGLNFTIPGVNQVLTGVWLLSGDKHQPNSMLAVDGFAQKFSRATPADNTNPPTAHSYDPECTILKNHLK